MPERAQPCLIGRTIDYIFGRNTLIGVASVMLLIISGYSTWHGMRDFIVGVSADVPDVADVARDLRRQTPAARAADHIPAVRIPCNLLHRDR